MSVCTRCGAEQRDAAKFCSECGETLPEMHILSSGEMVKRKEGFTLGEWFWFKGTVKRIPFIIANVAVAGLVYATKFLIQPELSAGEENNRLVLALVLVTVGGLSLWCTACNVARRLRDIEINPWNAIWILAVFGLPDVLANFSWASTILRIAGLVIGVYLAFTPTDGWLLMK